MKLAILDAKNDSYDAATWRRYDALYRGGVAFRACIGEFLAQNDMESDSSYHKRKREAHYRSYVGPIVDYFAAQLFASQMVVRASVDDNQVDPDEYYAHLKEDADGVGTDLVDFMRSRFTDALIKRASWWIVEMPSDGGAKPASRAEWNERRLGDAKLRAIDAECVFDWDCDDDGALLWVITATQCKPRPDPRLGRRLVKATWKLYDRTNVETFEIVYDPSETRLDPEMDIASVGIGPHGFSEVPIVRMCVPEGLWLCNRIADAQVEHFRLSSGLGWAIRRTCYAVPVFKSADADKPPRAGANFITIGEKEDFDFVSPDAGPFAIIASTIKDQKDEIYRVAQQMASGVDNNAAAIGRSAASKNADAGATEVCLAAYGAFVREAIERTYQLISQGRGDGYKWSIEGLDRFSLADAEQTVANALQAQSIGIPSETFRRELFVQVANALLPNIDQQRKDAIRLEIDNGVSAESEMAELIDRESRRGESSASSAADSQVQEDQE